MLSFLMAASLAWSQEAQDDTFVVNMKADKVIQTLATKGLCSSSASARMCRALPWIPSKNEGALQVEGYVYLFLNSANLLRTLPFWKTSNFFLYGASLLCHNFGVPRKRPTPYSGLVCKGFGGFI
jgi:hypothetical protein